MDTVSARSSCFAVRILFVAAWLHRCDDERICVVSSSEVEMAEGYLLFYAKRKQQQVEQQEQQPDEEQCHTGNDS